MKVFHSLAEMAGSAPAVATIGNFDGVHRGHRWVFDRMHERARRLGLSTLAITFDPHPVRILRPDAPHALITPRAEKLAQLASTGLDAVLLLPFTPELSRLPPESFAQTILRDGCKVREVHEGENFRFGYRGTGDMQTLAGLGRGLGFDVVSYPPLRLRGETVSSSRIRTLLGSPGRMGEARALLGRPFSIVSTPAPGRGYGTRYTVPTINLARYDELIPAHGVYATTLQVGAECFHAVTNVGNRPTFGEDSFTIESHLLDFHPVELTPDTRLELTFLKWLRAERRFPSPEALRAQIGLDVAQAQRLFHGLKLRTPDRFS